ncbi:hypothetical protein DFH07DRAFT_442799 [Mycena maculata]|uniref:Uncharacterized protein n=1 Tax=Mycena maculata TaxID=230809 RepID=A0AAD7J8U5_9AGAR|nr:hypothetical protein DFH07DRAFT_442799 [Mycena maculata]
MVPYHSESYSRAYNHTYDRYDDSEAREHAWSISDLSGDYSCISRSPEDLNRHGERFSLRHDSYSEPPQERNHTTYNETRRTPNYSLPSDYASLREENIVLQTENSMLKTTNQSLMSLLSQGPLTSISTNPLMYPAPNRSTLHEKDYPKVKYWQRSKWTKVVDKRRGISGGDVISRNSLAFIEDSDGCTPTDAKITEMRNWCYSFFFELQKRRTAPAV